MQQFITNYGYLAIFVLMLAESACIPVPSELIMTFGGALAAGAVPGTHLNLIGVILAGTAGNVAGSYIAWAVGRYGGQPLLRRLARAAWAGICCASTTWTAPLPGSTGTAARPCSSGACSRSSGPSSRCPPGSRKCPRCGSASTRPSAASRGPRRWPWRGTPWAPTGSRSSNAFHGPELHHRRGRAGGPGVLAVWRYVRRRQTEARREARPERAARPGRRWPGFS